MARPRMVVSFACAGLSKVVNWCLRWVGLGWLSGSLSVRSQWLPWWRSLVVVVWWLGCPRLAWAGPARVLPLSFTPRLAEAPLLPRQGPSKTLAKTPAKTLAKTLAKTPPKNLQYKICVSDFLAPLICRFFGGVLDRDLSRGPPACTAVAFVWLKQRIRTPRDLNRKTNAAMAVVTSGDDGASRTGPLPDRTFQQPERENLQHGTWQQSGPQPHCGGVGPRESTWTIGQRSLEINGSNTAKGKIWGDFFWILDRVLRPSLAWVGVATPCFASANKLAKNSFIGNLS